MLDTVKTKPAYENQPPVDDRIHLKIKIKNLADEATTIRKEERKLSGMAKWKLQHHRKTVVRSAARRSLIAYQIIRGKDWNDPLSLEHLRSDMKEIERMVRKYGSAEAVDRLRGCKTEKRMFL